MALHASVWSDSSYVRSSSGDYVFKTVLYNLHTIWLFTYSDLKTILFPQTLFGILTALAQVQQETTGFNNDKVHEVLKRIPMVMFWIWIHLLPVDIHNQQQQDAIEEDRINKSWRPLPSRRCTLTQARSAMILFYSIAALLSYEIGLLRWTMSIIILGSHFSFTAWASFGKLIGITGTWYNSFGGSDVNPLIRNFLNALAYALFSLGALEIAQNEQLNFGHLGKPGHSDLPSLEMWVIVLTLVIMTTIQLQDMEDQEGDMLKGRRSMPLQVGDGPTRWVTAIFMVLWGFLCPYFWDCDWSGYLAATALACLIALRSIAYRTVEHDKTTFRMWNMWIVGLYMLPVLRTGQYTEAM
ncbi:UbiA prenyltransferase family [Nemania sp. FL0916]|nr:UbiA prenyltransferase family [Nemania sp. FL0916]